MEPPEIPRRSASRFYTLIISRVLAMFPIMAIFLLTSVFVYSYSIGPDASHNPSGAQLVGLVVITIISGPLGALLGGLVWGFLGKKLLGFNRDEVEPFLRPVLPIAVFTRYSTWYMDFLFGPRSDVSAGLRGTSDLVALNAQFDDMTVFKKFVYECTAAAIKAHWDEQTTKQFNSATLKTDWWQARWGTLRVMPDALAFDDWTLLYTDIDDVVVAFIQGYVPSYVIRLKSRGNSYQFSVTGSYFGGELAFPARRTTVKGFTWFNFMVRLLPLIALLPFVLWNRMR